jgi:hypothetical protein
MRLLLMLDDDLDRIRRFKAIVARHHPDALLKSRRCLRSTKSERTYQFTKDHLVDAMTHDQFWQIINIACQSDIRIANEWDTRLTDALAKLPAEEIIAWNHIFDQLAAQAYRTDLWAAAYLINGGASDDGFYYFRCWLIGMGKQIYNAAVADPNYLANVASPEWFAAGIDAEAEIYGAAHRAWLRVTGQPDTANYPARNESAQLHGEEWDFDDAEEMRRHLPQLAALYRR